ncbi:MAG: TraM recognition domain-containing protein [Parcubacteria group bacterium]|nr:TraM recognition domain-containing protein [Parcubacteria group bacterium]
MSDSLFLIIIIGGIILGTILYFLLKKKNFKLELKTSFNYRLFLVSVPREFASDDEKRKEIKDFLTPFEQLIDKFSHYNKNIVLELVNPYNSDEIRFYFAVNRTDADLFVKTVSSLFPSAQIEAVNDYTVFSPQGIALGGILKLKRSFVLPLKDFYDSKEDPGITLINAFSKTAVEEGMGLQIIFKADKTKKDKILNSVKKGLLEGKSLDEALAAPKTIIQDSFKKQLQKEEDKNKEKEKPKIVDEIMVKLVENKAQHPLFEVNIRFVVSAKTQTRAEELFSHLKEAFNAFYNPVGNDLEITKITRGPKLKQLVYDFSFRHFRGNQILNLNSAEIATIFHLPYPHIDNPRIKWLKARSAPPPLNLPQEGIILGTSIFEGNEKQVKIRDEDRRRHVYTVGQTGTGKTTLLKSCFIQDIEQGKGGAFIDPHGDAALEILGLIPESRQNDVIYFNPGDTQYAMGLNMLDWDNRYTFQKTFVINELLEIVDKLYDLKLTGGPLFEQYFRYSLHLLLDDKENIYTLSDVVRVFQDEEFRNGLLSRTPDPMVKAFWEKQAVQLKGEWALPQMSAYIVSKLTPFLANDLVRPIVNQKKTTLDFRKIMDEGKILVVNLAKGILGDVNSYLMGMLLVAKLTMAAFSRQDIAEDQRKDFYLYIDEFQNVTTDSIATIFSEARKYRLNLFVGHQYLGQLKEEILKAVFGNVGTIISFRVGNEDADILSKYFAPVFSAADVINLDNFNAYIKLLINGQVARPFNMRLLKPIKSNLDWAHQLEKLSHQKYSRLRTEIEEEIRKYY